MKQAHDYSSSPWRHPLFTLTDKPQEKWRRVTWTAHGAAVSGAWGTCSLSVLQRCHRHRKKRPGRQQGPLCGDTAWLPSAPYAGRQARRSQEVDLFFEPVTFQFAEMS